MPMKKRWIGGWIVVAALVGLGVYATQVQAQLPSSGGGVSGYQRVAANSDASSSKNKSASATCPAGTVVTGGGNAISGSNPGSAVAYASASQGDDTWRVFAKRTVDIRKPWTLTAVAICVEGEGAAPTASPTGSPTGSPTSSPTASPSASPAG